MTRDDGVQAAVSLSLPELISLFNEGFSDYAVPFRMSPESFREHVLYNDIDLARSRVISDPVPASLALLGVRGSEAWVGGMATIPTRRGRGLGKRALRAALHEARAAGVRTVWLEVLESNQPALSLYEKLGFEVARSLTVWSLSARGNGSAPAPPADLDETHAWIVAARALREPWQRADGTLRRMREHGAGLGASAVRREGSVLAAIIHRSQTDPAGVVQWAMRDQEAALELLRAALRERDLRLPNVAPEDPLTPVLESLGGEVIARQLEMRLGL